MSEYSEPLSVVVPDDDRRINIVESNGEWLFCCVDTWNSQERNKYIADRIVACVNACAGVESVGGLGSVKRLVEAVRALPQCPKECLSKIKTNCRGCGWKNIESALAEFEKGGGK